MKRILFSALVAFSSSAALAAGSNFTLGVPGVAGMCDTTSASGNAWLAANSPFCAMATVAPTTNGVCISQTTVAGAAQVRLAANEAGFPVERIKPEYYLGEMIEPPDNVNWSATYAQFIADNRKGLLFDPVAQKVYVTEGGTVAMTWIKNDSSRVTMTYITAAACAGRPRRIYWTDHPYNAPAVDLSGKFVKFYGSASILEPKYSAYTNVVAGIPQEIDKRISSGLVLDPSTHLLNAYGELQGQVVMVYYDTGTFEQILHVQTVEICRPDVNVMKGEIGRALKPDGRGYDTTGLRAQPTQVSPTDNRGDYLYQHSGNYSYSPKHGYVYPLRPTIDCRWNAEVYWMETDEMEVQWPFELDHYECDWPKDTVVFVRGDMNGDRGRDIYIPTDYTPTLMNYQEPEGHAVAPTTDGTFTTSGEGYSLLKLDANDNVWFLPVHSVMRSDADYFTLEPADIAVGKELQLRGGSISGLAASFSPDCDPDSPGYIYEANSARIWNPNLYSAPNVASATGNGVSTNAVEAIGSGDGTNTYASVIYPVTANAAKPQIEVWWNTTIAEDGMAKPITIPTLPQVYSVRWPQDGEVPQIVIASQKGSACESIFMHNNALYLAEADSYGQLVERTCFSTGEGTVMFWMRDFGGIKSGNAAVLSLSSSGKTLSFDLRPSGTSTNVVVTLGGTSLITHSLASDAASATCAIPAGWHNVALSVSNNVATLYIDGASVGVAQNDNLEAFLGGSVEGAIGAYNGTAARQGVEIGELLFLNRALDGAEIKSEMLATHDGSEAAVTACYTFVDGIDLAATLSEYGTFFEKVFDIECSAYNCLRNENGPPAQGVFDFGADNDTMPRVYVQNDSGNDAYNPNEEHAFVTGGGEECTVWALRSDLNKSGESEPGVLVEYVKDGRKKMQYFGVVLTNDVYAVLADDCIAGKAIPGPHPLDLFDDPWSPRTYWDETSATSPAHRDRKGQLWARAAGELNVHMYYPMQDGFAFPSINSKDWPQVGQSVPWLSLLDASVDPVNVLTAPPADWKWNVEWPEEVPEMEIGRTLTVTASGLPEVWNAKSVAVVWPATDDERDKTALLFDPTVAQKSGFSTSTYDNVAAAVADLGIKQGAGGNATLRKGKWTFDGLPPSVSSRFYIDTTADVTECIRLVGEQEDNPGGVSLLHVNVLNNDEREALKSLLDATASDSGKKAWREAIDALATAPVVPSPHRDVSGTEDIIDYAPRDHYALFTMGATNYVTIIENDSTNALMKVAAGDPINMHVFKVVPKYYTGRVVTREDPLNLLSQQLSVIYAEAFAGKPEDFIFEWRKCSPHIDGSVPLDFDSEYIQKFTPTNGITRFTIGAQGDTLANMVNTYYAMRYRAASTNAPSYAAMGYAWSEWTDPPALAEGWVQRVLNNVTPFTQRMRDLYDNEAETAVSMIRQAGAPYEGDVALSQDNLASVGLIQLYETLLSKAESMSLQLEIENPDANKQLQLAVARLADLYNLLGDEAYTDALNPTIGFGSNFDTVEKTGYELDYGAMSSALFCFDNQVPTLLDEELALLRGRTGANAPSTRLSPYYNRLVWNFTRGMRAGEVAYAVNYDISGNNKGVIDYSQAAEMYPQGHGDAYGHYLSALSGYYRLLRNPFFSWGPPAMGEMVVADSVLNVDYYDEAQFAKSAYNVAKTALDVVDRTARKAYRDNGGATGSGYIDVDESNNFGYGEWASRGGFGALCNWVVGNSMLEVEPTSGRFYSFGFDGKDSSIDMYLAEGTAPYFETNGTWTIELQVSPAAKQPDFLVSLLQISDDTSVLGLMLDASNTLSTLSALFDKTVYTNTVYSYTYTNETTVTSDRMDYSLFCVTNGNDIIEYWFNGQGTAPAALPDGANPFAAIAENGIPSAVDWSAEGWFISESGEPGELKPLVNTYEISEYVTSSLQMQGKNIVQLKGDSTSLIALKGSLDGVVISVLDASGALLAEESVPMLRHVEAREISIGGNDFEGEVGEVRFWEGVRRTNSELLAKREYVSPFSDGLSLYLRTISKTDSPEYLADTAVSDLSWQVSGGTWRSTQESGISVGFEDEGLKRIDRGTVSELSSLAAIVPQIQKKIDQMDAGLNPLGLAAGAIPFDIDPFGEGDGKSHFEQIRERAGTALANARKALDRAQENAGRMRLLQESQTAQEDMLETAELEFKNKLIEYYGYPYESDIGAGGTYPQGYDGPDIYHYAWMDPTLYGVDEIEPTAKCTLTTKKKPTIANVFVPFLPSSETEDEKTLTFQLSASGFVLKPSNISGKRRAQGKIQDALADFITAYGLLKAKISGCESRLEDFEYAISTAAYVKTPLAELKFFTQEAGLIFANIEASSMAALSCSINSLEAVGNVAEKTQNELLEGIPQIQGAGMTVNIDPRAIASVAVNAGYSALKTVQEKALLYAKNSVAILEAGQKTTDVATDMLINTMDLILDRLSQHSELLSAWYDYKSARADMLEAYQSLVVAQAAVETAVAEAERIIDERTLKRTQAVDTLTKMRYNEMFFRLERDSALTRYSSMFDLAQKYAYLAAQAYDYETGLLASDAESGERFMAEIVGARSLGEFDADGEPVVTSGDGDGGLADILARLDANWLVLKPRLGINNPQRYATWFSLRHELFRIYADERGDKNWKTALEKCVVSDLNAIPEFRRYCQPLSGSTAEKEPGIVIEFPSQIIYGYNFFGEESAGGDSPLDPTWYATHIASAGIHFSGYNDSALTKTPTAYLVPVGEDRMRAVGDPDTVLSWKVVDQTIPAPYAIGSTQLDDPDWTPLYDGTTGKNDLGARIRRHPSFRAYYAADGEAPDDSELDCTRLVGRSAWNTRWLLIIPSGAMNGNRDDAIDAFIDSVSDIKLGLKTYSASGN